MLSSARVVRCWVKSRNERNPTLSYQRIMPGLWGNCRSNAEKVGMTSSHHALTSRATRVLQWLVQTVAIP